MKYHFRLTREEKEILNKFLVVVKTSLLIGDEVDWAEAMTFVDLINKRTHGLVAIKFAKCSIQDAYDDTMKDIVYDVDDTLDAVVMAVIDYAKFWNNKNQ